MWTPSDRALVGDFGSGQALSNDQFRLLEPLTPPAKAGGGPRKTDMRRMLDGLFYVVRTGCQWRHLPPPPAFPPWQTVYGYMRAFQKAGVWEAMRHHLLVMLREQEGREASPTAAIIDTQSVKTTEKGGIAAMARPTRSGAQTPLRRRDQRPAAGGLVHAANLQDADSAGDLLKRIKRLYCWLEVVFANSVCNRLSVLLACFLLGLTLIIVRRNARTGFTVLPRRWVVKRTLGRFGRYRRLGRDYEQLPEVSETMVTLAAIRLRIHRLAHPNRKRLPSP
ncbi:IS5 family transposase [Azospirillum sp. SYSU D00513]|uniref:IS5 family transposase n=1 Tax=Azospirillum sp. SYSU D00513 TaxID=2812561 RepID=UPI001A96459C|nr:IS5 family transposase [Azospirillum sp. SYSU D00513]